MQIGYTKAVLDALEVSPPLDGFLVVLRSLPFRFFPLFYLLLIVIVLVSGRDFGPMQRAESRGGATGSATVPESPASDSQLEADTTGGGGGGGITPKAGTPLRSRNALIPFAAVIGVTFAGMILDGISKIEAGGNEVIGSIKRCVVRVAGFRLLFSDVRTCCFGCWEGFQRKLGMQEWSTRYRLWSEFAPRGKKQATTLFHAGETATTPQQRSTAHPPRQPRQLPAFL